MCASESMSICVCGVCAQVYECVHHCVYGSVCVCLGVCVFGSVCVGVCLIVFMGVCMYVCLSHEWCANNGGGGGGGGGQEKQGPLLGMTVISNYFVFI